MNTVLDFVQSLQEMKKTQLKWAETELSERAALLEKWAHALEGKAQVFAENVARAEQLPVSFVLENQIQASIQTLKSTAGIRLGENMSPLPTGLISVILPEAFSFRVLADRLSAALMAGNGVFVLTNPVNGLTGELWRELLNENLPVRIFQGGEDLFEILCTHPSIHAVSHYGYAEPAEKVLKLVSGSWKKWQITSGYHNSALILNDVSIPEVARQLVESCFIGLGQLHWNVSNIFVTESKLEEFKKEFMGALEAQEFHLSSESSLKRTQEAWGRFRAEGNGKALYGGEIKGERVLPMVVQDLTHCSTLQQDCLMAPLVLISPVKYAHEMMKWTNTSYYGMSAQIFAPEEKIEKFANQLEVSEVSANGWIEMMSTLPLGMKQSFSGIPDLHPFGGFFSNLRKIDRSQSRK